MKHRMDFKGALGVLSLLVFPTIVVVGMTIAFPLPMAVAAGLFVGLSFALGDMIGISGIIVALAIWSSLSLIISLACYRRLLVNPQERITFEWSR